MVQLEWIGKSLINDSESFTLFADNSLVLKSHLSRKAREKQMKRV